MWPAAWPTIRREATRPVHLVGLSLGEMVAQHVALRYPALTASLVLICTKPSADAATMLGRAEDTERRGMAASVEAMLRRWFTAAALADPGHPGVCYARSRLLRDDPAAVAGCWHSMAGHDLRQDLRRVMRPITVVAGRADATSSPAADEEFAALFPLARLDVREGPHLLCLERPTRPWPPSVATLTGSQACPAPPRGSDAGGARTCAASGSSRTRARGERGTLVMNSSPDGRPESSSLGLLMVLSRPAAPDEPAYHEWYEEEHIPARTRLPGWLTARRYAATDGGDTFLAYYDLENLDVLSDPEYADLRRNRSDREQTILRSVDFVDRRIYRPIQPGPGHAAVSGNGTLSSSLATCGPLLLCVWTEPAAGAEAEFHDWYEQEHLPLLARVPGWLRSRRFTLVDGAGPRFLAMHDLASTEFFAHPRYREAVSTPWRDAVVASRRAHERTLYRLLKRFDPEPSAGRRSASS
jgi:hypothetical protein